MSLDEVKIEGTLKPDGTLELDRKPTLAPGRVTVILRPGEAAKPARPLSSGFFQMMEEIWAGQKDRGHEPRSAEDVEAERRQFRQEVETELDAAIQLQEESRRLRRQADSGKEPP